MTMLLSSTVVVLRCSSPPPYTTVTLQKKDITLEYSNATAQCKQIRRVATWPQDNIIHSFIEHGKDLAL